jgi:hypothetical protein
MLDQLNVATIQQYGDMLGAPVPCVHGVALRAFYWTTIWTTAQAI